MSGTPRLLGHACVSVGVVDVCMRCAQADRAGADVLKADGNGFRFVLAVTRNRHSLCVGHEHVFTAWAKVSELRGRHHGRHFLSRFWTVSMGKLFRDMLVISRDPDGIFAVSREKSMWQLTGVV